MNSIDFEEIYVKDICDLLVRVPSVATIDCPIEKLFEKIIENPVTRHVYIVSDAEKLVGSIRLTNIAEYLFPEIIFDFDTMTTPIRMLENVSIETTRELMNDSPLYTRMDTSIFDMISAMKEVNVAELPIVDDDMRIIGEVNMLEVIKYCVKNYNKNR